MKLSGRPPRYVLTLVQGNCPLCKVPMIPFDKPYECPDQVLINLFPVLTGHSICKTCVYCDVSFLDLPYDSFLKHVHSCIKKITICPQCNESYPINGSTSSKDILKTFFPIHIKTKCTGVKCQHCWNKGEKWMIEQCEFIHCTLYECKI